MGHDDHCMGHDDYNTGHDDYNTGHDYNHLFMITIINGSSFIVQD